MEEHFQDHGNHNQEWYDPLATTIGTNARATQLNLANLIEIVEAAPGFGATFSK